MTDDKQEMQADGSGTHMTPPDAIGETASRRDSDMAGGLPNPGESGGGAYPNPHSEKSEDEEGGFTGGQSVKPYHGPGQLGSKELGKTSNATAKSD